MPGLLPPRMAADDDGSDRIRGAEVARIHRWQLASQVEARVDGARRHESGLNGRTHVGCNRARRWRSGDRVVCPVSLISVQLLAPMTGRTVGAGSLSGAISACNRCFCSMAAILRRCGLSLRQRESRAGADPRYSGGRPTTRHSSRCGSRWVSTVTWQYSVIHSITTSCSIRSFRGATTGVQFLISMSCTSSGAVSGSNHYDAYFSSCATSIFRGLLPRVRRIIVVRQAYESKKERCT